MIWIAFSGEVWERKILFGKSVTHFIIIVAEVPYNKLSCFQELKEKDAGGMLQVSDISATFAV